MAAANQMPKEPNWWGADFNGQKSPPKINTSEMHNAPQRRWSLQDKSVVLSAEVGSKLDAIADEFHQKTGKDLVITDGNRTPAIQAQRMYDKFMEGDTTTYTGYAGRQVRSAYDVGRAAGFDKAKILYNMTDKIGALLGEGHPVSMHLLNRGADIHDQDFSDQERALLSDVIRKHSGKPLPEGIPKHTHASF